MSAPLYVDAFAHHSWATLRVIDACAELSPERLATTAPGTFGSILDTVRHILAADSGYLFALTGGTVVPIDEERMELDELRALAQRYADHWSEVLGQDPDPEAIVVRRRDDGSETHAPAGIRLAQVVHHGSDHRSQIGTILTTMGIEPPSIDVWSYALATGRSTEVYPTS